MMGSFYALRGAPSKRRPAAARTPAARSLILAVLLAGGCAHRPPPPPPIAPRTRALVARAESAERGRHYLRARSLYQRAADGAPDRHSRAFALRALADALLFWGEYADAERELTVLVAIAPREVSAWHDLGILRYHDGDYAGAERALRRAIRIEPNQVPSRIALAALLVNRRRFRDALREYRSLLALDLPDHTRRAVRRAMALIRAQMAAPAPARPR